MHSAWLLNIVNRSELLSIFNAFRKSFYYTNESIGIATGILITAIHNAGLVTLTHTPSPMGFLANVLNRPKNESAFVILPVGYPAENATVPVIKRKKLEDIMKVYWLKKKKKSFFCWNILSSEFLSP